MNSQEFESKMNFIVEQQAQFAARLEKRDEREAEFERRHQIWKTEIEDILTRLARVTNEGFKDLNVKINALVDAQIRMEDEQRKTDEQLRLTSEQQRKTDEQQRKTDEQLRKTDEQLRKTDELVRRYLSGKRNGGINN